MQQSLGRIWLKKLDKKFSGRCSALPSSVAGDKIEVHGKVNLIIIFENASYHHVPYVADISEKSIFGLDLLKENNFKLEFKNNELHSR